MDNESTAVAWVNKLYQKTETFFTEMDDLRAQESLRYVENQLLTAGESVKHFCSGLIQNVCDMGNQVTSSPPEGIRKYGSLASQMASLEFDEGHQKGSCHYDNSVHELSGELVDQNHNDSPVEKQNDAGMDMGIEENAEAEMVFSSEIREVIASANENSKDISVFCRVSQPNTEETDGQVSFSAEVSNQKNISTSAESREMNDAIDVKYDVSPSHPTIHSDIFPKTYERGHLNIEPGSCDDAVSTISNDSDAPLQSEVEPHNTLDDSPTLSFSDGPSAEEDGINHCTKEGPTLGENCIVVDCNENCPASGYEADHIHYQKYLSRAFSSMLKLAKPQKHKKATFSKDLKESAESKYHDFSESEWEII